MTRRRLNDVERELIQHFDGLSRAYRLQMAVAWSFRAVIAGIAIDALLLTAGRMGLVTPAPAWLAFGPLLLVVTTTLAAVVMRPNDAKLAEHADRSLGLRERLITAVELRGADGHRLAGIQAADALQQLRRFRAAQAFPVAVSRRELAALALVALSIVGAALPARAGPDNEQARVVQTVKREAERLTALAGNAATETAVNADPLIASALGSAAKGLEKNPASPERAIAALAQSSQQLSGIATSNATGLREALARASAALRNNPATRQSMGRGTDDEQTAAALQTMANRAGSLSAQEREAMASALKASASSIAQLDARLSQSMRQGAEALAADSPNAAEALQRAAEQAALAGQAVQRQEAVEQALAQIDQSRAAISAAARRSAAERGGAPNAGATSNANAQNDRSRQPSTRGDDAAGRPNGAAEPGGSSPGTGSIDRSTQVFDPKAASHEEHIDSAGFENPTVSSSAQIGQADTGQATVDYRDVYANYRDRASAATQDRYIPMDMKELVKSYFSSLAP